MADPETISSVTHDGITVTGRGDIREELGLPAKEASDPVAPEKAADAPASTPESQPPSKSQETHERIQRLTWEREEAKRQAAELASENARLKTPTPAPAKRTDDYDLDPADPEPQEDTFDNYRDYTKSLARWEARQEFKVQARQSFERSRQARLDQQRYEADAAFVNALQEYKASHPGYEAKVSASDLALTAPMVDGIKEAKSPAVMEYLVDNPKEVDRIMAMRPARQYAEMLILATRLEAAPAGSAPTARPTTKAQPPINPVSGSHVVPKDDGPPGDDADDKTWFDYAERQSRKRA